MTKRILLTLLILFELFFFFNSMEAQVTIGSNLAPTRAALLELKTKQQSITGVTSINDSKLETSDKGGLLLPRVQLVNTMTLEPFIPTTDAAWDGGTAQKELSLSLVGLTVYNIAMVGTSLYPALYTWDGTKWVTYQANPSQLEIVTQPQAFSFYETGEETVIPLTVSINGAFGTVKYQWYQVTGSNVHVRVGTPIGGSGSVTGTGATTDNFRPSGVIKGTTCNANNTGFYKFYCEISDDLKTIQTNTVEIAVGCGAKNNAGEWITFLCFNLGVDKDMTIDKQKTTTISAYSYATVGGLHDYVSGEEKVWGDLYQWGRIADGHEKRNSDIAPKGTLADTNIASGNKCSANDTRRPYIQIAKSATTWYGKFITTGTSPYNWHPNANQNTLDQLWRTSRFIQNDPCAHLKSDGTLQEFWHEGTDETSVGITACVDPNTSWRIPTQEEWGSIYKGGLLSGSSVVATANSWKWYSPESGNTNLTKTRGFEIQPDNETTTLFLPSSGRRGIGDGKLYYQGTIGYYWSTSISKNNSAMLAFSAGNVNLSADAGRASGYSLRCIKNQ